MADLKDIVRVAKYLAQYRGKEKIDKASLEEACAFFDGLSNTPVVKELLPFGPAILAAYEAMPLMTLDDEARELRAKLESDTAKGTLKFKDDAYRSPDLNDQVKALRSLLVRDESKWKEQLKLYKPSESDKAVEFAASFLKYMPRVQGEVTRAEVQDDDSTRKASEGREESAQVELAREQSDVTLPDAERVAVDVRTIKESLAAVKDQHFAVDELLNEFLLRNWGLGQPDKPAVFLMVGPSGAGKTFMAQALSRCSVWEGKTLFIDMGTMRSRNEGFALTGLRHGYESAGPGRLTQFVHEHPDALVVLENFSSAHSSVQDLLIPLLSEGSLNDEYGFGEKADKGKPASRRVSFEKATVVLTTRRGEVVYGAPGFRRRLKEDLAGTVANLLEEVSLPASEEPDDARSNEADRPSALLAHLGGCRLLPFQPLGLSALVQIAWSSLEALQAQLAKRRITLKIGDESKTEEELVALTLALSQAPAIQAAEMHLVASRRLAPALLKAVDGGARHIALSLDDVGHAELFALQKDLETLQSDMLRRNERLEFKVTPSDDASTLRITDVERVRLPLHSAHSGDGGISVVLPETGFEGIVGHVEVKKRLQQVLELLKPSGAAAGSTLPLPPKGMLLYGKPGTGKTMLAKALAADAALPFIAVTGSQLLSLKTLRKTFRLARQYAPCLVFIDEIDALGVRGKGGHEAQINQLLSEIDGFVESRDGHVFVLAATNFPQNVDPALTRAGRLDLRVEVPVLDKAARLHFLAELHPVTQPALTEEQLAELAGLTAGMSGADLRKLVREVRLLRYSRGEGGVAYGDVLETLNVIRYGARILHPSAPMLREQLEATAYHEAGHAVVSRLLNPHVRIQQVSIVPRGNALGFTAYDPETVQRHSHNRQEVMDLICVALAGRIAESRRFPGPSAESDEAVSLGGPDSGAARDLRQATELAWMAITQWGLDEEFGWISLGPFDNLPGPLHEVAAQRAKAWIAQARLQTERLVDEHWELVRKVAEALLLCDVLGETQFLKLMGEGK